jgi:hypothetical protein
MLSAERWRGAGSVIKFQSVSMHSHGQQLRLGAKTC